MLQDGFLFMNLLNELGKKIRCEALPSTYRFSPSSFINSIIEQDECNSVYYLTLKSHLLSDFCTKT